jgi:uncharacterized protein (TIGR03086 family)
MDTLQRYTRAQDGFDRIVAAVPPDRWDTRSACPEWTLRDVLGHVVWGQELVRHLATGRTYASTVGAPGAPDPGQLIGADPVGTWRAARAATDPTLTPAALAGIVHLRHTWDIADPLGIDVRPASDLVPGCFEWARRNVQRVPGGIGPELVPPPGADAQTRLLAFLGRGAPALRETPLIGL